MKATRQLDDLDKTLEVLLKDPDFRKEWEKSEAEYQFGRQIIASRIANKLSQRGLAKKVGTTQAVISRIENMTVSPSLRMIDRIARAFGKTVQIKFV